VSGATRLLVLALLVAAGVPCVSTAARAAPAAADGNAAHAHDFDFAFGTWKTHIKRLVHPLSGSSEWAEYDGTHVIDKVWDGSANLGFETLVQFNRLGTLLPEWGKEIAATHAKQTNQFRAIIDRPGGATGPLNNLGLRITRPGANGSVSPDGRF